MGHGLVASWMWSFRVSPIAVWLPCRGLNPSRTGSDQAMSEKIREKMICFLLPAEVIEQKMYLT